MINSKTQRIGLIGNPIAHSKSPDMHNAAINQLGLNALYFAFPVEPSMLKEAVEGFKAPDFKGFNITLPFKVEVMAFLDEITEEAREIGAVNTVVNHNGKLIGYNTDGEGYLRSLVEETKLNLRDKKIAIIGAGGAARAIGYTLAQEGIKEIYILNRSMEKAERLAESLSKYTNVVVAELKNSKELINKTDIIINTTSIGMAPDMDNAPIDLTWIKPTHIVSDIIYNPLETKLLREAKKKGAKIHTGIGMFIYQGVIAFEKWFGITPDPKLMRKTVLEQLKNR